MGKHLVVSIIVVALLAGLAYALSIPGTPLVKQVTKKFDLNNTATQAKQGTATLYWNIQKDSSYRVTLTAWPNGLAFDKDYLYEGWLVDDETDYKLSLGAFQAGNNGKGFQKFEQVMIDPTVYDRYVITMEPVGDADPTSAAALLEAIIG